MKRGYYFFLALLILLMLASPTVHAREGDETLEDSLTDHLSSKEEVKWYRFEMDEPGDAEITVRGLQEQWDGWNSHWTVTIYAPDRETILDRQNARGYNAQYSPPAVFSLLDLESGTYYIRISNASDMHSTTDSFRLELKRTFRQEQPFVSVGDEMYVMGEEPFLDRLTSPEQIRWYGLEMAEKGDVLLSITGMQAEWDGYSNHWRCTLYRDDMETAVTATDVRGYSAGRGPNVLSAPGLEAGTYYLQMRSTSSANPLMTAFTTAPYEISLLRYYHSHLAAYDGDGVQTFQNAGDVLWSLDGTGFLKVSDGECFGALMRSKDGAVVPILVSTDAAAVEYLISSTGEKIQADGPFHHKDSGIDYYYSKCEYIHRYTESSLKTSSLPILYVDTNSPHAAAETVADKLLETEMGEQEYWWKQNEGTVTIACTVVIGLAVLIILGKIIGTGGGGGGSGGDDVYMDRTGSIAEAVSDWWSDGV